MSISIKWENNHGILEKDTGLIATSDDLETAIIISLFTDALASKEDELPATQTNRRGWWGNCLQNNNNEIGSKLWLLRREKQQVEIVHRAIEYAKKSLSWMRKEGIAKDVKVNGSIARDGWLFLEINIFKPDNQQSHFKFKFNWQAQEEKNALQQT